MSKRIRLSWHDRLMLTEALTALRQESTELIRQLRSIDANTTKIEHAIQHIEGKLERIEELRKRLDEEAA